MFPSVSVPGQINENTVIVMIINLNSVHCIAKEKAQNFLYHKA
jgi:hypothetical protein